MPQYCYLAPFITCCSSLHTFLPPPFYSKHMQPCLWPKWYNTLQFLFFPPADERSNIAQKKCKDSLAGASQQVDNLKNADKHKHLTTNAERLSGSLPRDWIHHSISAQSKIRGCCWMQLLHYVSHNKFAPQNFRVGLVSWTAFLGGVGEGHKSTVWILSSSLSCSQNVKLLQGNTGKVKFWRFTPPRRFLPRSPIKLHPIFDLPTTCTLLCYSKPGIIIKLKSMALNVFKYLLSWLSMGC